MRFSLIAAVLPALFACNGAIARVGALPTTLTLGAFDAKQEKRDEALDKKLNICRC